jgi:uncharacterized repeat protein (TIGR02543 family)
MSSNLFSLGLLLTISLSLLAILNVAKNKFIPSDPFVDQQQESLQNPRLSRQRFIAQETYTVTFNSNGGGTPTPTSMNVTSGTPYGTLATVSRTSYEFLGWFTAASGGTQITSTSTVTATSNHDLFAHWALVYHTAETGCGSTCQCSLISQSTYPDVHCDCYPCPTSRSAQATQVITLVSLPGTLSLEDAAKIFEAIFRDTGINFIKCTDPNGAPISCPSIKTSYDMKSECLARCGCPGGANTTLNYSNGNVSQCACLPCLPTSRLRRSGQQQYFYTVIILGANTLEDARDEMVFWTCTLRASFVTCTWNLTPLTCPNPDDCPSSGSNKGLLGLLGLLGLIPLILCVLLVLLCLLRSKRNARSVHFATFDPNYPPQ